MKSLNQLLLDFNYEQNFRDDDFYVGKSNFYPFELINKWPKWEKNFLNISGEKFSGKTHLTNIDLISNFYILNFDSQNIQYRIVYNGSPKKFLNDMVNRNFDLAMENNVWKVK